MAEDAFEGWLADEVAGKYFIKKKKAAASSANPNTTIKFILVHDQHLFSQFRLIDFISFSRIHDFTDANLT